MRIVIVATMILLLLIAFLTAGCNKERIVDSKEYIHDIEYVNLPPDTVTVPDTIVRIDSVAVVSKDTVRIVDTLKINTVVHDTIRVTTVVHDTVYSVHNNYDTVVVTDTVVRTQCTPNSSLAVAAMELQSDPLVRDFIYQNYGENDGWILYLTPAQMDIAQASANVWDIYAYADYYASDWSADCPLEMYWRLTYLGGDPANADSWSLGDPPTSTSSHRNGISRVSTAAPSLKLLK
jgi:hypothetical protein